MNELDNILKAINIADLDGVREVSVSMKDMLILRKAVKANLYLIEALKKERTILSSKLALKVLETPIRLDYYA